MKVFNKIIKKIKSKISKKMFITLIVSLVFISTAFLLIFNSQNEKYTIEFNTDGGNEISSIIYKKGEIIDLPIPVKDGYTFISWTLDGKNIESKIKIENNMSLFATWEKDNIIKYKVSFNTNGGTEIETIEVNENSTFDIPSEPQKEGYTFVEWQLNGEKYIFTNPVVDNITLDAIWNKGADDSVKYDVKFDTNGGSYISTQHIRENGKAIQPGNPTKSGYQFKEWQLNGKKYNFDSLITKNITLVATYDKIENNSNASTNSDTNTNTNTNSDTNTNTDTNSNTESNYVYSSDIPKVNNLFIKYDPQDVVIITLEYPSDKITGYEIYRSESSNDNYIKLASVKGNYYQEDIDTSKEYKYKARAYKESNGKIYYGEYSDLVTVPKKLSIPTVYFNITQISTTMTFSNVGASKYEIYSSSNNKNFTYLLSGLDKYIEYTIQCNKYNLDGCNSFYDNDSYYKAIAVIEGDHYKNCSNYTKSYFVPHLSGNLNLSANVRRETTITTVNNISSYSYNVTGLLTWSSIANVDSYTIYESNVTGSERRSYELDSSKTSFEINNSNLFKEYGVSACKKGENYSNCIIGGIKPTIEEVTINN